MLRYKTNKQALIIAAVIILLCIICLTGSTLALFTNDPNKGTIGIITTTGRVDVNIIDSNNTSLEGQVLQFYTNSNNRDIEFEPGAGFYTQGFKIVNEGNIPIKFHMYISEDDSEDMEAFHEAFEMWITTDPTNTASMQKLTEFYGELKYQSDASETYYLFVRMKSSAGNTFQNKEFTGIGITVYAVQGNADITDFKE